MLKLFYSTSSAGGFFSPLAHKRKPAVFPAGFAGKRRMRGGSCFYTSLSPDSVCSCV